MDAKTLDSDATCAIVLFDGCGALDVIGFRESIRQSLASITLLGKDPVIKSDLGFIRFRADMDYATCAPPRILVLPSASATGNSAHIDESVLKWVKAAADRATLIIAIGNGADVLRAANASFLTPRENLIQAATGTQAATILEACLKHWPATSPSHAETADLQTVDGVWSRIQHYLHNRQPPYLC